MSEQKTLIRITPGNHHGFVSVNGKQVTLPTDGTPVEVTDDILGALENSNAEFEKVGAALSDAPAGEGDGSGEQPSPSQPPADKPEPEPEASDELQPLTADELAVLDQAVPKVVAAVKDWPAGKLGLLVAAENAGNTRKSLIAAIEALPQTHAPAA